MERDSPLKTSSANRFISSTIRLYGQGVADNFRNEANKLGLKVWGYEGTEERANFSPIVTPMKAKNPT